MSIKKRTIIILLIIIFVLSVFLSLPALPVTTISVPLKVVIDAGHGGSDGGSVSPFSGIDENHINLEYAFCLQEVMENAGIKVVMTRTNLNGLYPLYSNNRKKDDMKKRKEIIDKSNADLVVSIHMNSFSLSSSFGCQTFYNPNNNASVILAKNIQSLFVKNLKNARANAQGGDYFILNCTDKPAVLVECGFLSNKEEEQLLLTKEYKLALCNLVLYGIILTVY